MSKPEVPSGIEHLTLIERGSTIAERMSADVAHVNDCEREVIGTALNALYQAATCHRKCYGGPHILEALSGRLYNLGSSAYLLASRGYYDESLNLVRSMGEISNLISMSVIDKTAFNKWIASDKKTRLREFGPARVRTLLQQKAPELLIADSDWYSHFCESYTHATPHTKPNIDSETGRARAGGTFQPRRYATTLGELAMVLASVALIVCRYFKFDDLFGEIRCAIQAMGQTQNTT